MPTPTLLCLNTGSASLKFALFNLADCTGPQLPTAQLRGEIDSHDGQATLRWTDAQGQSHRTASAEPRGDIPAALLPSRGRYGLSRRLFSVPCLILLRPRSAWFICLARRCAPGSFSLICTSYESLGYRLECHPVARCEYRPRRHPAQRAR